RFYVQQNVYQAFTDLFLERVRAINVGDGLDPTNHMGPLAQTRRVAAMQAFVDDAVSHGAKVFQGGAPRGTRGNYFPPTVLTKLSNDCLFMNDEPFGPVVGIVPFDTLENVLEEAN